MHRSILKKADIVCVKSYTPLGRLIRFFTRSFGEARTKVNHVGIVSMDGRIEDVNMIEALHKVVEHGLREEYSSRRVKIAIYRPLNVTDRDRQMIVNRGRHYVGKNYGYLDLLCHLADWALLGTYAFRRLTDEPDYPICSWLVAETYASVNLNFGVPAGQAQPDDIWDFCVRTEGKYYRKVRDLQPLET